MESIRRVLARVRGQPARSYDKYDNKKPQAFAHEFLDRIPLPDNRLLRKYGFDTPNEARALRLYIHHKARALAAAKQHEIDRAFDMRRSRPGTS